MLSGSGGDGFKPGQVGRGMHSTSVFKSCLNKKI